MTHPHKYSNHDSNETRIALLEQTIGHIDQSLMRIESRIDKMDVKIDKIENRLWQIMFLISSSVIGMIIGKIFHWF